MRRRIVDRVAPPIYAAIDVAVILTPALAIKVASDRGGMGDAEGNSLIVASIVLASLHGVVAWARLRSEERVAERRADMWIAAVDSLVVLALGATLLPMAILYGFADEHTSLVDRGYPVAALWIGVQAVAIGASELTGRAVFRWLEPFPRRGRSRRTPSVSPEPRSTGPGSERAGNRGPGAPSPLVGRGRTGRQA